MYLSVFNIDVSIVLQNQEAIVENESRLSNDIFLLVQQFRHLVSGTLENHRYFQQFNVKSCSVIMCTYSINHARNIRICLLYTSYKKLTLTTAYSIQPASGLNLFFIIFRTQLKYTNGPTDYSPTKSRIPYKLIYVATQLTIQARILILKIPVDH